MPLGNLQQAAQSLYILSSPTSPMRDLLAAITRQLSLTVPPSDARALDGAFSEIQMVELRYSALRDFVGNGPGAPIDNVLQLLINLQQKLAKAAAVSVGAIAPAASWNDSVEQLATEAARDPQPVQR